MRRSRSFFISILLSAGVLVFLLLTACNVSVAPTSPARPVEDAQSGSPINAPLVESPSLVNIHFVNSLDGWGVTETQIVRTNDGGVTWYNVTPPALTQTGYSVYVSFLDTDHAWVQLPDVESFPDSGKLYRTSDGGITWVSNSVPFGAADISFLDENNGWVMAGLGVAAGSNAVAIFQTADGGVSWTQKYSNDPNNGTAEQSLPLGGLKSGLVPVNMQTAWVHGVTYSSGTVYLFRTDSGGVNWSPIQLPLPPNAENYELSIEQDQMKFVSPNDGYIAMRLTGNTYELAIYVSHDAGKTWMLTPTLIPDGGTADFMSANEAVVYNRQQFYVTRDAAATWNIIPPDVKFGDTFNGLDFVDANTGWVLTLDPNVHRSLYRTTDGGAAWLPVVP